MNRKSMKILNKWLFNSNRKPLVVRGARQVGKSTLVRLFAAEKKIQLLELNFENLRLKTLSDEVINIEKIIQEIESYVNCKLTENTLLFLDEIQQQPKIIQALRYFYEKTPHIPVIAAGSLLEFVLEKATFPMPVGRIEFLHLGPMSFFEFLEARGKLELIEQVEKCLPFISAFQHEQLDLLLKEYFFVGGMPEAVKTFIETKSPIEVTQVHRNIIQSYRADFPKYSYKGTLNRVELVFDRIADFLGKKVKYSEISNDFQAREIKQALNLLKQARVIHFCIHTNGSGLPLKSQIDEKIYKVYFLDVGLMNYIYSTSWNSIQNYNDSSLLTKGLIAEQFAAQHLAYRDQGLEEPNLHYWLREKKANNAEVDFLISKDETVVPLEVKSGESGKLKSLVQFIYDKKLKEAYRFDLKDRTQSQDLIQENVTYKINTAKEGQTIHFLLNNWHLGLIEKI